MIRTKKTVRRIPVKKKIGLYNFLPKKHTMKPMINDIVNIAHLLVVIQVQKASVEQPVEEYNMM